MNIKQRTLIQINPRLELKQRKKKKPKQEEREGFNNKEKSQCSNLLDKGHPTDEDNNLS